MTGIISKIGRKAIKEVEEAFADDEVDAIKKAVMEGEHEV